MSQEQRVAGLHAVSALLRQQPDKIQRLWLDVRRRDTRLRQLAEQAGEAGVTITPVERDELDRLSPNPRHQGAVAEFQGNPQRHENDLLDLVAAADCPLVLVLDGVQDPHNLGACLRSADGAGVCAVVAPKDGAVGLNATVRKVASGGAETVPFIAVTNLARTLAKLQDQGLWIIGAAGEADTLVYDADLRVPIALVLGAEEKGLRRLTRERCDQLVQIPLAGSVASLNVSVAAAILLFEAVRQRRS